MEEKLGKDGAKAQELQAEVGRLQEDVPALQARAADLELQLGTAQEVRVCVCGGGVEMGWLGGEAVLWEWAGGEWGGATQFGSGAGANLPCCAAWHTSLFLPHHTHAN